MKRSLSVSWVSMLLVLLGFSACRQEQVEPAQAPAKEVSPFPAAFVAGSYEMIGRYPDSEQRYSGTMVISVSDDASNELSITRVIDGISTQAKGRVTTTREEVTVLRVAFEEAAQTFEATYLIGSDLDNYARMTGYVYRKDGETSLPGIEALFHDHYKAE